MIICPTVHVEESREWIEPPGEPSEHVGVCCAEITGVRTLEAAGPRDGAAGFEHV